MILLFTHPLRLETCNHLSLKSLVPQRVPLNSCVQGLCSLLIPSSSPVLNTQKTLSKYLLND